MVNNLLKPWWLGVLLIGLMSLSSCDVIVDFGLKDTTQELYDARIPDLGAYNTLPGILPGYQENDPSYRYLINFYSNDKCVASYYAADTLNYEVEGTWSLPKHDVLRIDLDEYVDGDFLMTKLEKDVFYLTTDYNYIEALNADSVKFSMYIKRHH
jgi:hypothetical protein